VVFLLLSVVWGITRLSKDNLTRGEDTTDSYFKKLSGKETSYFKRHFQMKPPCTTNINVNKRYFQNGEFKRKKRNENKSVKL
jgi:hypothetical protein